MSAQSARAKAVIVTAFVLMCLPRLATWNSNDRPLCTTFVGPAFIVPDEPRSTVAVHAGQLRGISFISLDTGRLESTLIVPQRFLAASITPGTDALKLALADGSTTTISTVDVASHKIVSTRVFKALDAELAVFAPNGKYLLGVTAGGTVFRADLTGEEVDTIEGLTVRATSVAVSPTSAKLYLAGDGLTTVDIEHMTVTSALTAEMHLLEVAVSPDDRSLVLRNWSSLEVFDLQEEAKGRKPLGSVIVDPVLNTHSIDSTRRLAFAPDSASLFYMRASDRESELISLPMQPLHISARSPVGSHADAIAIAHGRRWVLLVTGAMGKEQLEAIDMKSQAVIFEAPLPGNGPTPATASDGCGKG